MKTGVLRATAVLGGLLAFGAGSASACGTVTIAEMNWQSAELIANVDKLILQAGYDCDAQLVAGDTVPTITSMVEKGQPDIAPEAWLDLLPEVAARGVNEGSLVVAGKTLVEGGQQGIWVPKYILDAHPGIKTLPDALNHPELFPAPEDAGKGGLYNGPQGWGSVIVVTQLFKAFKAADKGFVLIDPGSAAGLDGSMVRSYERKEGWLGQYWTPTSLLGKYEFVRLEHGVPHDPVEWKRCTTVPECPDPKPNAWPIDRVNVVVSKKFADSAGEALDYLKKRSWKNADLNKLLAWMADNQVTGEDGAKHFLKENEAIWSPWVSPDVAEKLKSSL